MVRVAHNTKLDIKDIAAQAGLHICAFKKRKPCNHPHLEWHDNTFAVNLDRSLLEFESLGGNMHSISTNRQGNAVKQGLQKSITQALAKLQPSHLPKLLDDIRLRMMRWNLEVLPGNITSRVQRRFDEIKGSVQPATTAVYLRTLLNGWPTHRRLSSLPNHGLNYHCPFCIQFRDALEHFPFCTVIKSVYFSNGINLRSLDDFLAMDSGSFPEDTCKIVRLLSAVYLARNTIIHSSEHLLSPIIVLKAAVASNLT